MDDHEIAQARQNEILAMKDDDRVVLEQHLRQCALYYGLKMGWPVYELYECGDGECVFTGSLFEVEQFLHELTTAEDLRNYPDLN